MRISGLASGMNTDEIIEKLMSAHRIPMDKTAQKKQLLEWKRDDYRALNNKILEFQKAAFDMKLQSSYSAKKATLSEESYVSIKTGSAAPEGQYTIKVDQLATSAALNSKVLGTGTTKADTTLETLNPALSGTETFQINDIDIEVDKSMSISQLVGKINEQSAATGVKAVYDAGMDRMFFTSSKAGAESKVDLKFGAGSEMNSILGLENNDPNKGPLDSNSTSIGKNSIVEINGIRQEYSSNNVTAFGMNISLKKESNGNITNVDVKQDVDSAFDNIKKFVEKYNALMDEVNKEVSEKRFRTFQPLTSEEREAMSEDEIKKWEEKARSGMLRNDSLLNNGLISFRRSLSDKIQGIAAGGFDQLANIGISNTNIANGVISGSYDDKGKLYIDETKLRAALAENSEGVTELFTKSGTAPDGSDDGIATRLSDSAFALYQQIAEKAGTANAVDTRFAIGRETKILDDQLARFTTRLQDLETRYYKQFTAMETYINKMNSQSTWLSQQFS